MCVDQHLPYAEELDIDFVRKRLLKRVRLLPSLIIRFGVHFVREWDLLVVARWQKADFMDHPREAIRRSVEWFRESFGEGLPPSSVGAARKPKDANPIMNLVWGSGHRSLSSLAIRGCTYSFASKIHIRLWDRISNQRRRGDIVDSPIMWESKLDAMAMSRF